MSRSLYVAPIAWALLAGCKPTVSSTKPPAAPKAEPNPVASPVSPDVEPKVVEPGDAEAVPGDAPLHKPTAGAFEPIAFNDDSLKRIAKVQRYVTAAASRRALDPNLLNAIIWTESKFHPRARNRSGAKGLMQLMPRTSRAMAKRLGRASRPYDPEFAVEAGALLLSILLEKFDGDIDLALFGYARGSGSVRKWQGTNEPMPEGVRKFIAKVRRAQRSFAELHAAMT